MSDPKHTITTVAVLTKHVYDKLEKEVHPPMVNGSTTELQAGYLLGIQHVLKMLRTGYVIDR